MKSLSLIFLSFIFLPLHGQVNLLCSDYYSTSDGQVTLDAEYIIDPLSIESSHGTLSHFDGNNNILYLDSVNTDSLRICFRYLSLKKNDVFLKHHFSEYDSNAVFTSKTIVPLDSRSTELFETSGINKSGSLTREVNFGNTQSASVNSSFNFFMDGKLSDNLKIRANISDQNIPYQPEGNTLQLREFDNIFIQVYNDSLDFRVGDIVFNDNSSVFLKYNKNVQGASVSKTYRLSKDIVAESYVGTSLAKGQFMDLTITSEEGVQGPYQLTDPEGQVNVITLANSEKVYVDGRLLTRGYNNDYTIDYNLGELSFNPTIPITQFSRIRVTFEYSDQTYSRSILNVKQDFKSNNSTFYFKFYQEKDQKDTPLAFELSNEDKLLMSLADQSASLIPIDGSSTAQYSEGAMLYELRDTVDLDGNDAQVYVNSSDSSRTLYNVSFSDVGVGNGSYVLMDNSVNGRTYQWVSPENGIEMGDFDAVKFIKPPTSKNMAVAGFSSQLSDRFKVYSEAAISNHDSNLFSNNDNYDNAGKAGKFGIQSSNISIGNYELSSEIDVEYNDKDFRAIDRFRSIEFDRNWGYKAELDSLRSCQYIVNAKVLLSKDVYNSFNYSFSKRNKSKSIDGSSHNLEVKKSFNHLKFSTKLYRMRNQNIMDKVSWDKFSFGSFYDRYFAIVGYNCDSDNNLIRDASTDTLKASLMNYSSHKFYIKNSDSLNTKFNLSYTKRKDNRVAENELKAFTESSIISGNVLTNISNKHEISSAFNWRQVVYLEGFDDYQNETFFLGNLNWRGKMLDKHIRSDLSYQTSSSREIIREYIFVRVINGQGTHTWRDLNGDGLQDIIEFFEAINFDERNYIKVFVPTSESVAAFTTLFNLTVNMNLPRKWKRKVGLKKVLSKCELLVNINVNKKNTDDAFSSRFNPFYFNISDENLIFNRSAFRSTLFYNKLGRGFGGDVFYHLSETKQLNTQGIDGRHFSRLGNNFRYSFKTDVTINLHYSNENKINNSSFQGSTGFHIVSHKLEPSVVVQPKKNFRITTTYSLMFNNNIVEGKESSKIETVKVNSRFTKGVSNSFLFGFNYTNIVYNGDTDSMVSYELLQALQAGRNYSWNINYNQNLVSGLQMTLAYEGRASIGNPVVHFGRMQITALF